MKRIEWADLKNLGATDRQLNAYNDTDPLDITESDGSYTMRGIVERTGLSLEDLLEGLDSLADLEDDE